MDLFFERYAELFSFYEEEQREACRRLESQILPQSSLGEEAYFVIPVLVDLVRDKKLPACAYDLLEILTICVEPDAYDAGMDLDGVRVSLTERCRLRILEGLPWYVRDIEDRTRSAALRIAAIDIVCRLREPIEQCLPALRRVFHANDEIEEVRATIREWAEDYPAILEPF